MAAKPPDLTAFENLDRDEQDLALRLVFGKEEARRFTQDTPVLPEVWLSYVANPTGRVDVLLTPYQESTFGVATPGRIARAIRNRFEAAYEPARLSDVELTYNLSTVVAKFRFEELVRIVLPMSRWWQTRVVERTASATQDVGESDTATEGAKAQEPLLQVIADAKKRSLIVEDLEWSERMLVERGRIDPTHRLLLPPDVLWMVRVIGVIGLLGKEKERKAKEKEQATKEKERTTKEKKGAGKGKGKAASPTGAAKPLRLEDVQSRLWIEEDLLDHRRVVDAAAELLKGADQPAPDSDDPDEFFTATPRVYSVSLNREATLSVFRSRVVIKADAAERVFEISCARLNWAVIDAGIDARHKVFRKWVGANNPGAPFETDPRRNNTRIVDTIDFTLSRTVTTILGDLKLDSLLPAEKGADYQSTAEKTLKEKMKERWDQLPDFVRDRLCRPRLRSTVTLLSDCLRAGRDIDWSLLGLLLRVPHDPDGYRWPSLEHGTHVAGILAGNWYEGVPKYLESEVRGVCPDLNLYDLRVFDADPVNQEFNIMSALQFVRSLNASHKEVMTIHGVNLSLSLRHAVDNYACGRTPICLECDRLSSSGVVVVAAAGNYGYRREGAVPSLKDSYRTVSITDPGNADAVITVGSTHREEPHNYGVSYFSSRGPTADGRRKPDLIAPGEKIVGPVPGGAVLYRAMDGTSMAAPHVSGVAALLMARNPELIGRPERIKQILCETATDLGRDQYFQGHGLVDTLRALQSV